MEPQGLTKLAELVDRDLTGWILTRCYFLELDTRSSGRYPAITSKDGSVVLVREQELLQQVLRCMSTYEQFLRTKISSILFLLHPASGLGFSLQVTPAEMNTVRVRVFTNEDVEALCQHERPFEWASGCIRL
jgi:hypothetical protein